MKNLGIFYKFCNYLNLKMLRQLFYTLIYCYLNYGALSWGNTYQMYLSKICTKQHKCICSIFANKRDSALPYYLRFGNVAKFKLCSLAHKLLYNNPSSVPSIFHHFLTPVTTVHSYNTRNSTTVNALFTVQKLGPTWANSLLSTLYQFFGNCPLDTKTSVKPKPILETLQGQFNHFANVCLLFVCFLLSACLSIYLLLLLP